MSSLWKNRFFAVYKAIYEPVDQFVTIRVFRTNACRDEFFYRRFQQEVKRLGSLNHRNIASVMDFGVLDDGLPYMVSEFLPGSSLTEILQSVGRISIERTAFVGINVAAALAHASEHGVGHEMLRTSDIYVVRDKEAGDVIKVTGFSMASLLRKLGLHLQDPLEVAEAIGVPYYMSPEQCMERETDTRSDIYSLGAILYECLSGQPPFPSLDTREVIRMHVQARYPPLPYLRKDTALPQELIDVIDKCLSKDLTLRYQFPQEMEEDLLNRRSPVERERLLAAAKSEQTLSRASARVEELQQSTVLPLTKVTAVFAGVILLGMAFWGLLTFTSRFANEGAWQGALERARRQYIQRHFSDSIDSSLTALKEAEKFAQPDVRVAITLNDLAAAQLVTGNFVEAEENLKRALEVERSTSTESRTKARTMQLLSEARFGRGDHLKSEELARKALATWQTVADVKPAETLCSYLALLRPLCEQKKLDEAKSVYESAKSLAASNSDIPEHISGGLRQSLAMLTLGEGDLRTSERILKELLSTRQSNFGLNDPLSAETMVLLARVYQKQKKHDQAAAALENAFGILKQNYGEEAPITASIPGLLAEVQDESGDMEEAEKNYRLSLEMQERIWGARSPHMVPYIGALGRFLRKRGSVNAAEVYETEIKEIEALERKTTAASAAPPG